MTQKLYTGWYDLSTLKIDDLTLEMIPNFTSEMDKRRLELFDKLDKVIDTKEDRNEYGTLEFIRAADFYRDQVLLDWVITEEEKPNVIRALQCLARVNKIKAGIDNY